MLLHNMSRTPENTGYLFHCFLQNTPKYRYLRLIRGSCVTAHLMHPFNRFIHYFLEPAAHHFYQLGQLIVIYSCMY